MGPGDIRANRRMIWRPYLGPSWGRQAPFVLTSEGEQHTPFMLTSTGSMVTTCLVHFYAFSRSTRITHPWSINRNLASWQLPKKFRNYEQPSIMAPCRANRERVEVGDAEDSGTSASVLQNEHWHVLRECRRRYSKQSKRRARQRVERY